MVKVTASKRQAKEGDTITFTATATGAKGAVEYKWYVEGGSVIGSNTSKTIKVSTKNFTGTITADASVVTTTGRCEPAHSYVEVKVIKK